MFGNDLEPLRNWRGELIRRKKPFYRRAWFSALTALVFLAGAAAFQIRKLAYLTRLPGPSHQLKVAAGWLADWPR
jgi:NADH dehydrogenase FAD-containing subunit